MRGSEDGLHVLFVKSTLDSPGVNACPCFPCFLSSVNSFARLLFFATRCFSNFRPFCRFFRMAVPASKKFQAVLDLCAVGFLVRQSVLPFSNSLQISTENHTRRNPTTRPNSRMSRHHYRLLQLPLNRSVYQLLNNLQEELKPIHGKATALVGLFTQPLPLLPTRIYPPSAKVRCKLRFSRAKFTPQPSLACVPYISLLPPHW